MAEGIDRNMKLSERVSIPALILFFGAMGMAMVDSFLEWKATDLATKFIFVAFMVSMAIFEYKNNKYVWVALYAVLIVPMFLITISDFLALFSS